MNDYKTAGPIYEDDVEWDLELAYAGSKIQEEDLRVDIERWSSWPKFRHPHRNESIFQLQAGTGVLCVICAAYWASHLSESVPYVTIPAFPTTSTHLQRHVERKRHYIALQYLDKDFSIKIDLGSFRCKENDSEPSLCKHHFSNGPVSPNSFYKLITILDSFYHNTTLDRVQKCGFFSVMLDTSQDLTVTKQLSVIIQFCTVNGLVETFLLGLVPTISRATGSIQCQKLKELLQKNGLSIQNCVGIGFDGDAANIGKTKGILALARKDNTNILGFHCAAHRGQLAIQDTFKNPSNSDFPFVISLAEDIASWLRASSNRLLEYTKSLEDNGKTANLPVLPNHTRWLTRYPLLVQTKQNFHEISAAIRKEADSFTHDHPYHQFHTSLYYFKLCSLVYILEPVQQFSVAVQEETLDYSQLLLLIDRTEQNLRLKSIPAAFNVQFLHFCNQFGADVKMKTEERREVKESLLRYIHILIQCFQMRMKDTAPWSQIGNLTFAKIRDSKNVKLLISSSTVVIKQFKNYFLPDEHSNLRTEIQSLQTALQQNRTSDLSCFSDIAVFISLHPDLQSCNTLQKMYKILSILPITTVPVESSFSSMKHIKTPSRSSITNKHLDILLRIAINAPEFASEEDLTHMFHIWMKIPHLEVPTQTPSLLLEST
ncbi:hypothetical protein BLNAU_16477 [Blattamonas nauphoetae]|uniref:HAT C-terminal dimerisation domain-containing protein n=1 Tax=Blattamonas nauphoetae TaxID=2049346 RepID=A0ABQ9X891_9EUKA|nr:hypothetical protein BLNAU_16477 [Blattamonas nauphoetae]